MKMKLLFRQLKLSREGLFIKWPRDEQSIEEGVTIYSGGFDYTVNTNKTPFKLELTYEV